MIIIEGKIWLTMAELMKWTGRTSTNTIYGWRNYRESPIPFKNISMNGTKHFFYPVEEVRKWIQDEFGWDPGPFKNQVLNRRKRC